MLRYFSNLLVIIDFTHTFTKKIALCNESLRFLLFLYTGKLYLNSVLKKVQKVFS